MTRTQARSTILARLASKPILSPGACSRGFPLERAAARVCREAGATVACNVLGRDLNIHPERLDDRRIEVIANWLPLLGGAQLAVDTTLVSLLDASGAVRRHQRQYQGAALRLARKANERTYLELMRSQRCRFVILALEVGGRWSPEAFQFVRLLARCRARAVPRPLRPSTIAAFTSRWSALLAFSAARAFGASLLGLSHPGIANVDSNQPLLSEVLASTRFDEAPPETTASACEGVVASKAPTPPPHPGGRHWPAHEGERPRRRRATNIAWDERTQTGPRVGCISYLSRELNAVFWSPSRASSNLLNVRICRCGGFFISRCVFPSPESMPWV